jgi:hypothetical protein
MAKVFKPIQQNQKVHAMNVKFLANHLLNLARNNQLFKQESQLKELSDEGDVLNYPKGKFNLPVKDSKRKTWNTTTKAVQIQSPKEGAYAFVIQTGRDFVATVYCTKNDNIGMYSCEGYFSRVGSNTVKEDLGKQTFNLNPDLVNKE